MANFDEAYKRTIKFEGGYSNKANDRGGETYRGITRKNFPKWSGWSAIDIYKSQSSKPSYINMKAAVDTQLQYFVKEFYRKNFWDACKVEICENQSFANNVFDFAVNSGVVQSTKIAQRALGIADDGIIGKITLAAYKTASEDVISKFRELRISFYKYLASKYPTENDFLSGWIDRAKNA